MNFIHAGEVPVVSTNVRWRVWGLVCLLGASFAWGGESAAKLYRQGRDAEMKGHVTEAYLLYSQAAALDPYNPMYWARSQGLRTRAMMASKVTTKIPAPKAAPDPSLAAVTGSLTPQELAETSQPQPPRALQAAPGKKDLDFQGDAKQLFEQVAHAFQLDTVFDGEYTGDRRFRFRLDGADYKEALHALEAATGSFAAPLSERLILVAKDTPQKRLQVEPMTAMAIPIPEPVSVQDAQELAKSVQQVCDIRRLTVDTTRRVVFVRDTVSKVRLAEKLFAQLLQRRTQVMVQMQFLEVTHSSALDYGFSLPTEVPVFYFGGFMKSVATTVSGFTSAATFGGGKTLLGIGIASAEAIATMSQSNSQNLLEAELRSVDGQVVSFHVGQKYPVLTGRLLSTTSATAFTGANSFTFEDLGLTLKVTPHIHGSEEVTLETEAEFKVLGDQTALSVPIIANRKFQCQARLRAGEWAVISGLLTDSEARTLSGIAGLASLPVVGPLFREHTKTHDDRTVLLLLKPVLLTLPPGETPQPAQWVGSEARFLTPL